MPSFPLLWRQRVNPRCAVLAVLALLLALAGCAHVGDGKRPVAVFTTEAFNYFNGEYRVTETFKKRPPSSVAVLPFTGDPKSWTFAPQGTDPAAIVRRAMYNHFSSLPFQDLELTETDQRLAADGLVDPVEIATLAETDPDRLARLLAVDAVITGEVTHFDRVYMGIFSQAAVGCRVQMRDLATGDLLWEAEHVSRAAGGGVSLTPIGLALDALASLWNLRGEQLLRETDEVFREMVGAIEANLPEIALTPRPRQPNLDLFVCLDADKPFTAGRTMVFRLVGDPGGRAYADLPGFKSGIELHPLPPALNQAVRAQTLAALAARYREQGVAPTPEALAAVGKILETRDIYQGEYVVSPGEEAYGLLASGRLSTPRGGLARRVYTTRRIDVDAIPPAAPLNLSALPLDGKVALRWTASPEPDLARYEVLLSPTAISGYAVVHTTEEPKALLGELANFQPVHLRVAAVDKAGNRGKPSDPIRTAPLPEPGLDALPSPGPVLGGEIREPVLLAAGKGPFIVQRDVRILPGGALHVEPGAALRFAPGAALRVEGGALLLHGQAGSPIYLDAASPDAPPGSWTGVVLDRAKRAALRHVVIRHAAVGVRIRHSAPELFNVSLLGADQAGLLLEDGARPAILCSTLAGNRGMGGIVAQGQGMGPRIRDTVFEDNRPFHVQNHAPLQLDLSGNFWGEGAPSGRLFLGDVLTEPHLAVLPESCPAPAGEQHFSPRRVAP